jgi:hypothetical protein
LVSCFVDVCRFNPTAGGTADWTYASTVPGYQSPAAAGTVNGAIYSYRAESLDLTQWEVGTGAYNTATGVLTRAAVLFNSLGTSAKVPFTLAPQIALVALAEDLNNFVRAIRIQKFTATGTYTPNSYLLYAVIECWGGGGGGGGVTGSSTQSKVAGGGSGGGYSRSVVTSATVGASRAVTIGAGGAGAPASSTAGTNGGDTSVAGTGCVGAGGTGGGAGGFWRPPVLAASGPETLQRPA